MHHFTHTCYKSLKKEKVYLLHFNSLKRFTFVEKENIRYCKKILESWPCLKKKMFLKNLYKKKFS